MKNARGQTVEKLLFPHIKRKIVLDLGCIDHHWRRSFREDWMHLFILKHAKEVLGLDYLEEDAKKLAQLGYNIRYGDAENFDLGRQFDVIFAGELIEHLENFRGFFESCKKHMNKESKLIITTPNCFALRYTLQHLFNRAYANPEHTCWFDEVTLGHLVHRHDLKIDGMNYISASREGAKGIKATILWTISNIPRSSPGLFLVATKK